MRRRWSGNSGGGRDGASCVVNAWNSGKRFVDCFLDDEGDPWFTYDINLSPGGTREALDDNFGVWLSFLPDMKDVAGWK